MKWETLVRRGIEFAQLEALQKECVDQVREAPDRGFLILSEPHPTFTRGRFAKRTDLLWSNEELLRREVATSATTRGGKWTYHGPGQIVVYPIVDVRRVGYERRAVYRLMNDLRLSIANGLKSLGVVSETRDRPFGLYIRERKIASFGMALQGGISSNGIAVYLEDQTPYFVGIHPCGVPGEKTTSLRELGFRFDWEKAALVLADHVKKGFKLAQN